MSKVYFTSDWHLGHKAILKYRSEFSSVEEHNNLFVENFNKTVKKRDTVYFLGDICFADEMGDVWVDCTEVEIIEGDIK